MCCCGGKPCLFWLCISIVLSLIAIGLLATLETYLGGPFPTRVWSLVFILIYTGNTISIIISIFTLLLFRTCSASFAGNFSWFIKLGIFTIVNVGLLFHCGVNIYFMIVIGKPVTVKEVSNYTRTYYKANRRPPPLIEWLETTTDIRLHPQFSVGCCGGASYEDYLPELPNCQLYKPQNYTFQFEGSKTCCIKRKRNDPFCASNLLLMDHELKLGYMEKIFMALRRVKSSKELGKFMITAQQAFLAELKPWLPTKVNFEHNQTKLKMYKPKYDCEVPVRERIHRFLSTSMDVPEGNLDIDLEDQVKSELILRLRNYLEDNQGINVLGCATAAFLALEDPSGIFSKSLHLPTSDGKSMTMSELLSEIIFAFRILAIIKLGFHVLGILAFNWYFFKLMGRDNDDEVDFELNIKKKHRSLKLKNLTSTFYAYNPSPSRQGSKTELIWQTPDRSNFPTSAKF